MKNGSSINDGSLNVPSCGSFHPSSRRTLEPTLLGFKGAQVVVQLLLWLRSPVREMHSMYI